MAITGGSSYNSITEFAGRTANAISPVLTFTYETVDKIITKVLEEAPAVVDRGSSLMLQRPDRRLSWGVTKKGDKSALVFLTEKEDTRAYSVADRLRKDFGGEGDIVIETIGRAYSSEPNTTLKQLSRGELCCGASIGHFGGFPGSIGVFARIKKFQGGDPWTAIVGASHVLAMNNKANKGDAVLHPGYPDGPKSLKNRAGVLVDYTYLVHHQEGSDAIQSLNTEDVALVKPDDQAKLPSVNLVPDPGAPGNPGDPNDLGRKIALTGVVEAQKLFGLIGERVYKLGRTTGFTEGVLEIVNVANQAIRLPNNNVYIYKDVAAVKRLGAKSFSAPGDSGAVVYTKDGRGVGLIIGGTSELTFISPLSLCLESMEADLLV